VGASTWIHMPMAGQARREASGRTGNAAGGILAIPPGVDPARCHFPGASRGPNSKSSYPIPMPVAKNQTEFTLAEARIEALDDLESVIDFARNLGNETGTSPLAVWAAVLEDLRNKVRVIAGPSLTKSEIQRVWEFGQKLITGIPDIAFQLSTFWSLHEAISARLQGSSDGERGYQPQERIAELSRRIDDADRFGMVVVREAQQSAGVLALGAILMVHIARVDTIEYALMKQLEEAVRRFKLEGEFDPAAMCSVEGKVSVQRDGKTQWRTDVRAIRDAAAHFRFRFEIGQNGWAIEFSNHDRGYQFERKFTRKQLMRFFDTHTLLYKSQLAMLKLSMIVHVLITHFWDGRESGGSRPTWPF